MIRKPVVEYSTQEPDYNCLQSYFISDYDYGFFRLRNGRLKNRFFYIKTSSPMQVTLRKCTAVQYRDREPRLYKENADV